jgi:hypothetical protein
MDCQCLPACDCMTDADCPEFHYCTDLCTCEQELCDCITDVDCPAGYYCTELCTCDPVCMCTTDADCDDGNPATLDQCIDCHCESLSCACDADMDGWCCCTDEPDGGCDCDDSDPNAHPGIEEICYDMIDNDCDGLVDENCGCGCLTDADCPADTLCWDCQCIPYYHCTTTSECPSGWLCQQHGVVCDENHPCDHGTCFPG